MAKQRFRGALNAATFPLLSTSQGRTVVQPQLDAGRQSPTSFYGTPESVESLVPQCLYCENVLPIAEGLQSVGYLQVVAGLPAVGTFDQAITLRDADENNFLFAPAGGANYIYVSSVGAWVSTNPITGATDKDVTRAYVNGRTFICYAGLGVYEYNTALNTFNKLTLIGLTDAEVQGIAASSNYLLAYTTVVVYWSSLINPLDFVPSYLTGAGFSTPQDVKANITAILSNAGGFIVYTSKNAVSATYTQNIRSPFTFKEVSNAGGVLTYEQVSGDQTAGPQYAWTTGGLQKITSQMAEAVSAEVNDFIAGKAYEIWNSTTKQIELAYTTAAEFGVKVSYIASRFVVISYSVDNSGLFQFALVYDTILKRWGKLVVDHVDCFAYPYPNVQGDTLYSGLTNVAYSELGLGSYASLSGGTQSATPSKGTVAFLSTNGAVSLLQMDYNKTAGQLGVAIFGKFQLIRARMMTMQQVDLEGTYSNVDGTPAITTTILSSLDGFNLDGVSTTVLVKQGRLLQRYARRVTGLNLAIVVEGTFALSSYLLEVTAEGDR